MGKINWARVLAGGLLAGFIINAAEAFTNGVVLGHDWEEAMKALGRQPMGPSVYAMFIIGGFVAGISAVWLYAVARPRFGPGPKTAACTGFAFWVIGYALPTLGQWAFNLFPGRLLIIGALAGLVEIILASLAGAWLYKE